MDLINKNFENLIGNQYLTENISILLYSWIRTTRPLKLLECGSGYSTICIAKALSDIRDEEYDPKISNYWNFFKNSFKKHDPENYSDSSYIKYINKLYKNCFVEDSSFTGKKYNPKLITVDNNKSLSKINNHDIILNALDVLNASQYVEFICDDFIKYINQVEENFDFVWVDIGDGTENKKIFDKIFPKLNPAGVIAFHSVATNVASRWFLAEMKLKSKLSDDFEMITLSEPHKKIQDSIVLFKKTCDYPIYHMSAQ